MKWLYSYYDMKSIYTGILSNDTIEMEWHHCTGKMRGKTEDIAWAYPI